MYQYSLTHINIYPVKSLPGISLKSSVVEERGLKFDRRWMLVDLENKFITQRLFPQMVFIEVQIEDGNLIFTHKRKPLNKLNILIDNVPLKNIRVNIWEDTCEALKYNDEVNEWFSEALNFKCKLVFMPIKTERKTSTKYYKESKSVSFADGYPFLIIGEESLNNLNSRLDVHVPMSNFRPNFVFSGGIPHDEDNWSIIKIGNLKFAVVKPCARCVITTIDQQSANKGKEPLLTLSKYRTIDNKIMFGQNAICLENGEIQIGDRLQVIE